jgi:hypothetical protein
MSPSLAASPPVVKPRPEGAEPQPPPAKKPPRKGKFPRLRAFVKRIDDSAPTKFLGLVLLIASAVTLGVSGYDKFIGGFSCSAQPVTFGGVPAANPTITNQQVNAVLRAYATGYGQHDKNGLGDLMPSHVCRYPSGGGSPETRSAALAEYQRQFDLQAHDPAHPHPTVTYAITQPHVVRGAGGPDRASVTAHFDLTAGAGGKDKLGHGRVGLHIVKQGDKLMIDQIVVR